MTATKNKVLPQPDLTTILQQKKPSLLAVSLEAVQRPRVRRVRAQTLTETMRTQFEVLLPKLPKEFSSERIAALEQAYRALPELFWLFYQADHQYDLSAGERSETFRLLVERVRGYDVELEQICLLLFRGVAQEQERIKKIQQGRGRRDDAEDVLAWLELLGRYPQQRAAYALLTDSYLTEAKIAASDLLQSLQISSVAESADLWRRAYTLWAESYRMLRKFALCLVPDDQAELFPGIHNEPSASPKPASEPTPAPSPVSPNPPTP
ncbi:hypothetical protein L6R29_19610 [Myxococcota bacterium]|nr:hypothetical protein [Myxococcota bacterium]